MSVYLFEAVRGAGKQIKTKSVELGRKARAQAKKAKYQVAR